MSEYLNALKCEGRQIVLSATGLSKLAPLLEQNSATCLVLNAFSDKQAKVFSSKLLAQIVDKTVEKLESVDEDYSSLFFALNYNPFLLTRVIPQVADICCRELVNQIEQAAITNVNADIVDSYYSWQWKGLDQDLQAWLILFSDLPNVILEMLSIASDERSQLQASKELKQLFGKLDTDVMAAIDRFEQAGFIERFPHGRLMKRVCLPFLNKAKANFALFEQAAEHISVLVAELLCHALTRIVPHSMEQYNQSVLNNILINRRIWAENMQVLWRKERFDVFLSAMITLHRLMKQNGVEKELLQWAAELLNCSFLSEEFTTLTAPQRIARLNLSLLCLQDRDSVMSADFNTAYSLWKDWFFQLEKDNIKQHIEPFMLSYQFCISYCRLHANYDELLILAEHGLLCFKTLKMTPQILASLDLLSDCCTARGDDNSASAFESELLTLAKEQFKAPEQLSQIAFKIIARRIKRENTVAAQDLLNEVRPNETNKPMTYLYKLFQADILHAREDYESAVKAYCDLWPDASASSVMQNNNEHILNQLKSVIAQLGESARLDLIKACAPPGSTRALLEK